MLYCALGTVQQNASKDKGYFMFFNRVVLTFKNKEKSAKYHVGYLLTVRGPKGRMSLSKLAKKLEISAKYHLG